MTGATSIGAAFAPGRDARGRLLAAGLGALALAALCAGAFGLERWRVARHLDRVLDAQAAELDRQLSQLALVPRLLADDPRIVAAASGDAAPGERAVADALLERAGAASGAAFAYLMDRTGLTVAASNHRDRLSFVGANYGFRPYFRGAAAGAETTFFAVGATTGEPGYFVARPVRASDRSDGSDGFEGRVVGVVAAKMSLDALVDAWRAQPHGSIVLDELGVVILSTEPGLLYAPSAPLGDGARRTLAADRRYEPGPDGVVSVAVAGARPDAVTVAGVGQLAASRALSNEPWRLYLLVPEARVARRGAALASAAAGAALIGLLLARLFRQQRRLAATEQRAARELERLVARRTGELEAAHRALIAQSNFAMLGRMSAAINHEINQPLASLRLDLATLRALVSRDRPPLDEMREAAVDADRTVRRIGRVVETLRSVARQGVGRLSPLDPARLLVEVAETVRRERPAAAEALATLAPDAPVAPVPGNAVLVQQAIMNLVHNALDAIADGAGSRVELALEDAADAVAIRVRDDGPGVDPSLADRLFEPFAGSPDGGGLGLGLALARQIATDHGGALDHRPGDGGGSVFRLSLPR